MTQGIRARGPLLGTEDYLPAELAASRFRDVARLAGATPALMINPRSIPSRGAN